MSSERSGQADLWSAVIDAAYDLTMLIRYDGVIELASASSQLLLGLAPAQLVGANGLDLAHPDDLETLLLALADNEQGMSVNRVLSRFRHADGSYVAFEIVATRLQRTDGSVGLVIGCRDMGGRHRASLDEPTERHLLHTVLHEVSVGVLATDADGSIMLMNQAMFGLLRLPQTSAAYTRWPAEVVLLHPESGDEFVGERHPLARLLAGEDVRDEELVVRRTDSTEAHVVARGRQLRRPNGDHVGVVLTLEDVTHDRAVTAALEMRALHDPLTGLPNRRLLNDRLEQAIARSARKGTHVAVLFCDLDHFKSVNDRIGHRAGDDLLVEIAERLRSVLPSGDTLARLGGDEFVLVCEVHTAADAAVVAGQITAALSMPIDVGGLLLSVSMTIGIAMGTGTDSAADLIRDADHAMYVAKQVGRARTEFFGDHVRSDNRRRLASDELLSRLLDDGRLEAVYQPIVSTADGGIVGVEALARLRLDDDTLVPACDFIETAELAGLIGRIDEWMLNEASRTAARMQRAFGPRCPMVTCNVSARELARVDFAEYVINATHAAGVAAHRMCLEITETSAVNVNATTLRSLNAIRATGMHLAVDDLGSGYSTLRLLRDLPFSIAKIDAGFIAQLPDRAADRIVVEGLVSIGHALGMKVLAEGVETEPQRLAVVDAKIDWYQGYLVGKGVDTEAAMAMVAAQVPSPNGVEGMQQN